MEHAVGILEDDDEVTRTLSAGLRAFGYQGIGVSSKEEAMVLARKGVKRFVLDIEVDSMPQGLDTLEEVKDLDPSTQAFIYSNHVEAQEYHRQAQRLKADLILEKKDLRQDTLVIAKAMLIRQQQLIVSRLAAVAAAQEDENIARYNRELEDSEWRRSNMGKVVGIVDGVIVCISKDVNQVLAELRKLHPMKKRFVKVVEAHEEILDVPTPLEVEDVGGSNV